MKRPSRPRPPVTYAAPLDMQRIASLADRALAGETVDTASVEECAALLRVLRERGYGLKRRTEQEQKAAPWRFVVELKEVRP
jgi:hypothetical protein